MSKDVLVVVAPPACPPARVDLAALGFGLGAAARSGGRCDALLAGPGARDAGGDVARLGLRRVWTLEHPDLEPFTAEAGAEAVRAFLSSRPYRLVASATSSASRELMPRLAALLGAPMASDVLALEALEEGRASFLRAVFAGNLHALVDLAGGVALCTCRASAFEPPASGGEPCGVEPVSLEGPLPGRRKRVVELERHRSDRPELAEAERVVSAGRGTRGPERGIPLVAALADVLGAALGATRAVVDAGWLPNELQVGQTGKVVAPKLYVAVGLSGSIQHLAGMRNSKTIVAINNDPDAPIFEVADLGLVADLFDAVPELTEKLKALRREG